MVKGFEIDTKVRKCFKRGIKYLKFDTLYFNQCIAMDRASKCWPIYYSATADIFGHQPNWDFGAFVVIFAEKE